MACEATGASGPVDTGAAFRRRAEAETEARALSRRITIPDAVIHQYVDREIILLHRTTERYYGLDDVGSRVWDLLKEHAAVDPIVAALLSDYDVDETTLRRDVNRLLDELADAGLIDVHEEPGS